jgi:hypothetical protein
VQYIKISGWYECNENIKSSGKVGGDIIDEVVGVVLGCIYVYY